MMSFIITDKLKKTVMAGTTAIAKRTKIIKITKTAKRTKEEEAKWKKSADL
jgi:hypothetical protein